ncbi:hypothetical protein [Ekhidna sp.]|uniref:hypothetical protein n=1 Tax=Ekhidna sp. TaxID=2608089 RepID=UPI0032ECE93D
MHKFLILLPLLSCGIDRTTNSISSAETSDLKDFEKLDHAHQVLIAGKDEPDKRLTLCLNFIDKSNRVPLTNRKIHFYHTNTMVSICRKLQVTSLQLVSMDQP